MSAAAASFSAAGGALNVNSISIGQSAPPASAWHGAGASQFAAAQHALQGRASDLSTASFIAKTLTTLAGQIATAKASIAAAQSQAASINAQTAQLNSSYQARTAAPPSPVNPVPMGPLPGESAIASDLAAQATACMAAAQHANDAARQAFHAAGAAFAGLADRSKANGTNWIDQGGSLASVAHGLYTTPAAASMVLRARLDGINGQVSDAARQMRTGATHDLRSAGASDLNAGVQSRAVAQSAEQQASQLADKVPFSKAANLAATSVTEVTKVPGLSKVPFVGAGITGVVAISDVSQGHYASAAENVAGLGASTIAFEVGMGMLAATPAGWAVRGLGRWQRGSAMSWPTRPRSGMASRTLPKGWTTSPSTQATT